MSNETKTHEVPRLDAYQWGELYDETGKIHFGMNPSDVAKQLRALADRFENGSIIAQSGVIYSHGDRADYPMTVLVLRFHQKGIPKA